MNPGRVESGRRRLDLPAWLVGVSWRLLLITIPVTSLPLITHALGGTLVGPLSLLPLSVLVLVWLVPYLIRGGSLHQFAAPLLVFVALAGVSTFHGFYLDIPAHSEVHLLRQGIDGLGTLSIGVGFYLIAATIPRTDRELRSTLTWITIGGLIMLIYSSVQLTWIFRPEEPVPYLWRDLHRLLSVRDPFRNRITGMAFEPSWAADQLVVLYLPLWLGAVLRRESFLLRRPRIPVLEGILATWGILVLAVTFSRIGLLALLAMLGAILGTVIWKAVSGPGSREKGTAGQVAFPRWSRSLKIVGSVMLAVALTLGLALGVLLLAAQIDDRIARLFEVDYPALLRGAQHPWVYSLANRLAYAERLMYWVAAARVFSMYPLLGVGLGNAGLFFKQTLPYFGYHLPEILNVLRSGIPNSKSLWIRLLAETGMLGFAMFVGWMILHGVLAYRCLRKQAGLIRLIGSATILSLIAQGFEGFSLDTFALPQLWIMLGLVAAASSINVSGTRPEEAVGLPRRAT